jgi:hypothetical protein
VIERNVVPSPLATRAVGTFFEQHVAAFFVDRHPREVDGFIPWRALEADAAQQDTPFWVLWQAFADRACRATWVPDLDAADTQGASDAWASAIPAHHADKRTIDKNTWSATAGDSSN